MSRGASFVALLACVAPLAVAAGSESWLGLVPCAFCLIERRPYQLGILLAALALVLPARASKVMLWLVLGALIVAGGLSFMHAGVEQHWWPDPLAACSAPNFTGMNAAQRFAAMPSRPAKPCEDPDYLIPGLPVSMTQMSTLYALVVSASLAMYLLNRKGRRTR